MPRSVAQVYAEQMLYVNRNNSIWARNVLPGGACLAAGGREAREAVAKMVGCAADEIAITRSGSDALQLLITNYKNIHAGDAVIYCDLDYDAMIAAMDWLGDHRGAQVVKFAMPEPATTEIFSLRTMPFSSGRRMRSCCLSPKYPTGPAS